MNELQKVVNAVLEQQKLILAPSTYDVRRCYLEQLSDHAEKTGFTKPCQELYDSYVSRADTPDLRFQLFHTVRLVDKEAGTRAFMPEGNLYNEPEISPSYEAESAFQTVAFPIIDGSVDIGHLIRRAENEMEYLPIRYPITSNGMSVMSNSRPGTTILLSWSQIGTTAQNTTASRKGCFLPHTRKKKLDATPITRYSTEWANFRTRM